MKTLKLSENKCKGEDKKAKAEKSRGEVGKVVLIGELKTNTQRWDR